MQDLPLVSVVVPVFNRSTVIKRAVASVLVQTFRDFEILIVDDGSEDEILLRKELESFRDPRIRLSRFRSNQGGAVARNTGVEAACGKWIAFLDSDDEWHPKKLERQLQVMKEKDADRTVVFTRSNVRTVQHDGPRSSVMPLRGPRVDERMGDYLFVDRGWLQTSSIFLSRKLARKVPFNPALRRHQDYDLLLRLEAEGSLFEMVGEPLVTVHWEDLHQTARGLNPENSLAFLKAYKQFFSPKARSGFVCGQIVMPLLRGRRRLSAAKHSLFGVRPWHLSMVQHVALISGFLFCDARIASALASFKQRLVG